MPVSFDCECGRRWWSPPHVGCTECGPDATAVPDPIIWSVDRIDVPHGDIFLSGQLRDPERFADLASSGISVFVDVAGAKRYVWRPTVDAIDVRGVTYMEVPGVEDVNTDLPAFAFEAVADAINDAVARKEPVLLFCAAGLKRSPHLLYGVLRSWGIDAEAAWAKISAARPFVDPWEPYLAAAERWVAMLAARPSEERLAANVRQRR